MWYTNPAVQRLATYPHPAPTNTKQKPHSTSPAPHQPTPHVPFPFPSPRATSTIRSSLRSMTLLRQAQALARALPQTMFIARNQTRYLMLRKSRTPHRHLMDQQIARATLTALHEASSCGTGGIVGVPTISTLRLSKPRVNLDSSPS